MNDCSLLIDIAQAEGAIETAHSSFELFVKDASIPLEVRMDTFNRCPAWLKQPVSRRAIPPDESIASMLRVGMILTEEQVDDLCDSAESDEQLVALCEYILRNKAGSIIA